MIVLCLQPSTPHPVFPIIPLHFYTHCAIPALQYLLSVCVCAHLCMWESPTRRTKVLMPFMEKARDSSFCYAWFVCLALGQSCRSPELFPFFWSCAHSPCVFVCVFKQGLHASGCLLCVWTCGPCDLCSRACMLIWMFLTSVKPQMKCLTASPYAAVRVSRSNIAVVM